MWAVTLLANIHLHLSVCLSTCLSTRLSVCLSIHLTVLQSVLVFVPVILLLYHQSGRSFQPTSLSISVKYVLSSRCFCLLAFLRFTSDPYPAASLAGGKSPAFLNSVTFFHPVFRIVHLKVAIISVSLLSVCF